MCKISSVIEIQGLKQQKQKPVNELNQSLNYGIKTLNLNLNLFSFFCDVPCVAVKWCEGTV